MKVHSLGKKRNPSGANDGGYTLVSLIAAIAVSCILMASIAPTWRHLVIRDKEEELIFRGEQYVLAIEIYQAKYNALPLRTKNLVKQRCIRRLYKDPMTGYEFELIFYTPAGNKRESQLTPRQLRNAFSEQPGSASLPIIGVVSRSTDQAIRKYLEKEYYNAWEFIAGNKQQQEQEQQEGPQESAEGM